MCVCVWMLICKCVCARALVHWKRKKKKKWNKCNSYKKCLDKIGTIGLPLIEIAAIATGGLWQKAYRPCSTLAGGSRARAHKHEDCVLKKNCYFQNAVRDTVYGSPQKRFRPFGGCRVNDIVSRVFDLWRSALVFVAVLNGEYGWKSHNSRK